MHSDFNTQFTVKSKLMDYTSYKHLKDQLPNGFCLAKWYQVTVDLTRAQNHSCHHPERHSIPEAELKQSIHALHNTTFKKSQRAKMLKGERPEECSYCWNIEDNAPNEISDRLIKSNDPWAYPFLEKTLALDANENIHPTYLEVIFSNECNLNCMYCMADVSSSIANEMKKHGPYPVLSNQHRMPRNPEISGENKYVEAFWKWLKEIAPTLQVLRITGGEPLLAKDTIILFNYLLQNPMPNLELAINTNLSFSEKNFSKYLFHMKELLGKKVINKLSIYTSLDTFGEEASYIRQGLNIDHFLKNIAVLKNECPEIEIVIMCTYNILSISNFKKLIQWIEEEKKHGTKITLDISYLKDPEYLRANLATDDLFETVKNDLHLMRTSSHFSNYETQKFERIVQWIYETKNHSDNLLYRRDFYHFTNEFDLRFNKTFSHIFPKYNAFYNLCKKSSFWFDLNNSKSSSI